MTPSGPELDGAGELANVRISPPTAGAAEVHGPWATPVRIARGSAYCIGRTPENELVLEGPTVSRRHATIVWAPEADRPTIEDLASANGTSVDGVPLQAGLPRPLLDGAVVDIGEHRLGVGRPAPGRKTPPPVSGPRPRTPDARGATKTTPRPTQVGYVSFNAKGAPSADERRGA